MIVREYECGCKITSEKHYPSIKYCPKHEAGPILYEACREIAKSPVPSAKAKNMVKQALATAGGK